MRERVSAAPLSLPPHLLTTPHSPIMCGILACIHHPDAAAYRPRMLNLSRCIRHRGPDWSGCVVTDESSQDTPKQGSILCHERLAIVGVGE